MCLISEAAPGPPAALETSMNKLIGLAATAAIPLTIAGLAVPAQAAGTVKFGSALDPSIQPSNSLPARPCVHQDPSLSCSFVMNEAYGRPNGGQLAPVSGTLKRIRVISGAAGSFRLQLVKAKQVNGVWRAQVKAVGPIINVQGQNQSNWDNDVYNVEQFRVKMKIKKGWRLSMSAMSTSAVRCSSGGDNTLIFAPPLTAAMHNATNTDGCWPLIEGVIKK